MPRAQRPCVDCQKLVTPNYSETVPRCKPCTTKLQRRRAAEREAERDSSATTKQSERAEELLREQDEQIVYRTKRTLQPARGGIKIAVIPDLQVGPGTPTDHLDWIGSYLADKTPEVVVQIGDWYDMPSLSSYDRGKLVFEGRRIKNDLAAGEASIVRLNKAMKRKGWNPRKLVTGGNHEDRIFRAVQEDPRLDGLLSMNDLAFQRLGWEYHEFLKPVKIEGVSFAHYFTSGPKGNPINSAKQVLAAVHGSAVCGHNQRFDIAVHDKTEHIAIISGACYIHDEQYLGPQQNSQKRQIVLLHEVKDGVFDPMFVSLAYLEKRFKS